MSQLGDDEVSLILYWIGDKVDRISFSQVCKQWLRVEGHARTFLRVYDFDSLHHFLPRFPNLESFESPKLITDAQLEFIVKTCPKLRSLNLNLKQSRVCEYFDGVDELTDIGDEGIRAVANGCRTVTKVLLRRRKNISNNGVISLVKCGRSLSCLDLGRCGWIEDRSLEAIAGMNLIRVLNLEGCSLITDRGLNYLANGSSSMTLKKLVLAECDRITDIGVSFLRRIWRLEELNLAECGPKVTDNGGTAVASISSLKRLNISWLINVSDITLLAIAENCLDLEALDLMGCEMITGAGIRAFVHHDTLESLVLPSCYSICGDDVDALLQCKSLRYIVLDRRLKMWIPVTVQESISKFCMLNWR